MKQFEQRKNGWRVTTETGECFATNLTPLEYYAMEVNDFHTSLLNEVLKKYNYLSLGEIQMWLGDKEFGTEAQQISDWYKSTYLIVSAHLESVKEYQEPEVFTSTIPTL
jgi:hypothetical protein